MVKITKFNGAEVFLNAELIETVEATPDTVIALTNGKKVMVKEAVDDIVNAVIEYRRSIFEKLHLVITNEEDA